MSGHAYALAMAALDVNGPEDESSDWGAIPFPGAITRATYGG
jgi:hypothetical protein